MEQTVERLKALGDEIRLRLVLLLRDGECCVCMLQEGLAISQPRISQHLCKLKYVGLVKDRKVGKWRHYSLTPAARRMLEKPLDKQLAELQRREPARRDAQRLRKSKKRKC